MINEIIISSWHYTLMSNSDLNFLIFLLIFSLVVIFWIWISSYSKSKNIVKLERKNHTLNEDHDIEIKLLNRKIQELEEIRSSDVLFYKSLSRLLDINFPSETFNKLTDLEHMLQGEIMYSVSWYQVFISKDLLNGIKKQIDWKIEQLVKENKQNLKQEWLKEDKTKTKKESKFDDVERFIKGF